MRRVTPGKQTISGQKIEYKEFPESKGVSYAARGSVSILEQGRLATCGEAIYDRENGKTTLRINPEITDNGQIISGSEIFLEYDEDILKSTIQTYKVQFKFNAVWLF